VGGGCEAPAGLSKPRPCGGVPRFAAAMLPFLRRLLSSRPPRNPDPGAAAEEAAARWLGIERGFRIVARNWRNPEDRREEIDLVARDGEILVFVEVKSRARGALVPGYHAVNRRKKNVLRRAISSYLRRLGDKPRTFRLDIVEVVPGIAGKGPPEILHFENIPLFPKHFRP